MEVKINNTSNTRNRDLSGSIWSLIFLSLTVSYIGLLIFLTFTLENMWTSEHIVLEFILYNFPTAFFLFGVIFSIKDEEYIRISSFTIYKFERYTNKDGEYKTLYIIDETIIKSKYILHKHIGDFEISRSSEELYNYCNNNPYVYPTKEDAMKEILNRVKNIILDEKAEINVKVKNITSVDTFTLDEVRKMVEK
jgi:hypothetical protein